MHPAFPSVADHGFGHPWNFPAQGREAEPGKSAPGGVLDADPDGAQLTC